MITIEKVRQAVINQCDGTFDGSRASLPEMSGIELEKFINELYIDLSSVKMGEVGQDTGLVDRMGNKVCIGDLIVYDTREFGVDKDGMPYTEMVEYDKGEISVLGGISAISEWCEVRK